MQGTMHTNKSTASARSVTGEDAAASKLEAYEYDGRVQSSHDETATLALRLNTKL